MTTPTTSLFLLDHLADDAMTSELARGDLDALRAVADWIETFVVRPHKDLGRPGPVCPFVPGALERNTLWLAPEQLAGQGVPQVVELLNRYQTLFLDTPPTDGDDVDGKVIVVVFTDLPADRAQGLFADALQRLAIPSYGDHGIVFGAFYEGNEGTAIYNGSFHPFTSPVPFVFVRRGVISDWKFFLDNEELLRLWGRRFGESAVSTLAGELRRLPWRAWHD
ncbi:DUF6875 domain-containing protein [Kribbella sp. NPDC050459]|uniref:DUF6875 domain-containing protein n=1 Tax=Kribbella sp. NPDC050459 TaxID=3155785 RepID=UPI0033D3BB35